MRISRNRLSLAIIVIVFTLAILSLIFRTVNIGGFERGSDDGPLGLRLGLDLQGGTLLIYRADDPGVTDQQVEGVVDVMSRRINAFGVTEPLIQRSGSNEIIVQLAGITDIDEAKTLIGGTAQLDYRECLDTQCSQNQPALAEGNGGVTKHLTGEFLRPTSSVVSDPTTGLPVVTFDFDGEGSRMFEQITRRNIGQPLGIFLDGGLISAPTVQSVISSSGRITGLSRSNARTLAIQLNAGALPVSISVVREDDVSATLGEDSLNKSYLAAMIGLALVMLFMLLYYRLLGLIAVAALVLYTVLVLAAFKLVGVTLTLSGLSAFVVSVGMAVDANVIIFERMREELRSGRTLGAAIEAGFDRAWSAIRDSQVTTFIVMLILWWFGDQLGEPRVIGFAITLMLAIIASVFTAFVVTRTILRLLVGTPLAGKPRLFADIREPQRTTPALS